MPINSAVKISNNGLSYKRLIDLFNELFYGLLNTRLEGGHPEPIYSPATKNEPARICFRENYPSSALHEVAHWCIAGEERRLQVDYGYWYEPDGRSNTKQQEFENVEVKPQALEWVFSVAAGILFQISVDSLDGQEEGNVEGGEVFAKAVAFQAKEYLESGLPERAQIYYQKLLEQE